MVSAEEVIRRLSLAPHPEVGFFRETLRDKTPATGARAASRERLGNDLAAGERPQLVAPAG
jgi:predicted cupin superfamily sugar epimerase